VTRHQWGVQSRDAVQREVVAALRDRAARGDSLAVRAAGHSLYGAARRAFGSWSEALAAAGLEVQSGGGADAQALARHLDAISPNQLEGLPPYMRQRQILGGALLERIADVARRTGDTSIADVSPGELQMALKYVLRQDLKVLIAEAEVEP
jgi:hypothetical protein